MHIPAYYFRSPKQSNKCSCNQKWTKWYFALQSFFIKKHQYYSYYSTKKESEKQANQNTWRAQDKAQQNSQLYVSKAHPFSL